MRALIGSSNKVNTMYTAYTTKLSLHAKKIDVGAQKIDKCHLDTFGMVIADYPVKDKLKRVQLLQ